VRLFDKAGYESIILKSVATESPMDLHIWNLIRPPPVMWL